jgi:hypothetical protein
MTGDRTRGRSFLVLYSVTILVLPVSRPAASYYPKFLLLVTNLKVDSVVYRLAFSTRVRTTAGSIPVYTIAKKTVIGMAEMQDTNLKIIYKLVAISQ